ncbi:MAG: FG-GAP-like repeat-containing protein [Myxococcota bacterium]
MLLVTWLHAAQAGELVEIAVAGLPQTGGIPFYEKEADPTWADVDLDGDWDAFVASVDGARLLVNQGGLGFVDETASRIPDLDFAGGKPSRGVLVGDLDHDGWPDVVQVRYNLLQVFYNAGGGTFPAAERWGLVDLPRQDPYDLTGASLEGAALLDVDLDGDLDVLVNNSLEGDVVLRNDGARTLTPVLQGLPLVEADYLTAADLDLDGDIDVILRTRDGGNAAWFAGGGNWSPGTGLDLASPEIDKVDKGAVLPCDVDNDGQLEIYWSNLEGYDRGFFARTGTTFAPWAGSPAVETDSEGTLSAACGDLDNDGLRDLFLGDAASDRAYLQGAGWAPVALAETDLTFGVALADDDDDGDLDVLTTGLPDNHLYRNDEPAADDHFQLRILATVRDCGLGRIVRDDIGGSAVVSDVNGPSFGRAEVSGGAGRGGTEWPVLHWGVPDGQPVTVTVHPLYGATPPYTLEVVPAALGTPHRLVVATDDRDGDGILDAFEPDDIDHDGVLSALDRDSDGDTLPDDLERGTGDVCAPPRDTDSDGTPDAYDTDSDDGGVPDGDEVAAGTDPLDPSDDFATTRPTTSTGSSATTTPATGTATGTVDLPPPLREVSVRATSGPCGCASTAGPTPLLGLAALLVARRRRYSGLISSSSSPGASLSA